MTDKQKKVRAYFEEQGCTLLEDYTHSMSKMRWLCPQGHENSTSWNNFSHSTRPRRCAVCNNRYRRSLEEIRQLFVDRGCEFLDEEFKGIHHNHRYRCKCGKEATISLAAFHHQGQHCKECGLASLPRGDRHHAWVEDREQLARRQSFRKRIYKMLRKTRLKTNTAKVSRTEEMLGYTHEELRAHIEGHSNWPLVKDQDWHLDHIYPIQAFLDREITDVKLINCLENLRPISQRENNEKKDKYDEAAFDVWLASKVAV